MFLGIGMSARRAAERKNDLTLIFCPIHLIGLAPLGKEVILVVVLDARPYAEEEETQRWIHHDIATEVFVSLIEHSAVVARVHHVTPTVLGRIDMHLGHAEHAHLLEVPPC